MPTTQTMTEEQRRAMFARMNGRGTSAEAAAARNPYKPEPASSWEVFKGGLSGFVEGAANGIANIINSASFGLTDAVGITHTGEQTGWDAEVSKIAADIAVIAASMAIAGAGKAGEKGTSLLGKKGLAKLEAKRAAKQALKQSEAALEKAARSMEYFEAEAEVAFEWAKEKGTKAAMRKAVEMDMKAAAATRQYNQAVFARSAAWDAVVRATHEARPVEELARELAKGRDLARGAAGVGTLLELGKTESDVKAIRSRRAEEEYNRRAAEILGGTY